MHPDVLKQKFLQVRDCFREGMGFRPLDALKSDPPFLLPLGWEKKSCGTLPSKVSVPRLMLASESEGITAICVWTEL